MRKPKFRPNLPDASARSRAKRVPGPGGTTTPTDAGNQLITEADAKTQSPPAVQDDATNGNATSPASPPGTCPPSTDPVNEVPAEVLPSIPPPSPTKTPMMKMMSPDRLRHDSTGGDPPMSPRPMSRPRRLTESRDLAPLPPSVYDKRKADHKKKFTKGVPERTKMTMFDLIYYNPLEGSRMSNSSSRRDSRTSSISEQERVVNDDAVVPDRLEAVRERLEEEAVDQISVGEGTPDKNANNSPTAEKEDDVDQPDEEEDEGLEKMPVPQVKVGPNGEMIIDEESTIIETTATKKAKEGMINTPLVFENSSQSTNYGSWGKKRKNVDWGERETVRFYKALSVFGTDFSMMEGVFKKRSRHELKMKFKKEERQNRALVDKCLRQGMQFDTSIFESEPDTGDEDDPKPKSRKRKNAAKKDAAKKPKRRRKAVSNRGYYASSDEEDERADDPPQPPPPSVIRSSIDSTLSSASTATDPALAASGEGGTGEKSESSSAAAAAVAAPTASEERHTPSTSNGTPSLVVNNKPPSRRRRPAIKPNLAVARKSSAPPSEAGGCSPLLKSLLTKDKSNHALDAVAAGLPPSSSSATSASPSSPAFPPGLLAANPSLASAVPGSLVVVATPSENNAQKQMLRVYLVNDNSSGEVGCATKEEASSSSSVAAVESSSSSLPKTCVEAASTSVDEHQPQ